MKKSLNEAVIFNELREGSAFFRKPLETTPPAIKLAEPNNQNKETHEPYEAYVSEETHDPREAYAPRETHASQETRKLIRRPIQIYEDQFNRMREICARTVLEGKPQLLRELFQEAIEDFLQKREPKNWKS